MKRRFYHIVPLILILCLVVLSMPTLSATEKKTARAVPIETSPIEDLRVSPSLSTADTCLAYLHDSLAWSITGWVYGNELYKNYINPEVTCPNPYPYAVTEVNMVMGFEAPTSLIVSVDVEQADMTNPSCPAPGPLLGISSTWELTISNPGLYNIWIPLDSPVVVTEPFFAGFYIGNGFDSTVNPSIITDDNSAAICASYNIWDTTIGFVDLNNNPDFNFPGRLVLYVSGIPGGTDPEPEISIVTPIANQKLFGNTQVMTLESSGSSIIDYVSFEYSDGGPFIEFDRDYEGYSPLRDELNNAGIGNGFLSEWDFSNLPEQSYTIRVTAVDTLGRSASDQVAVVLEPTPPVPDIITYENGMPFCDPLLLGMSTPDENVTEMEAFLKPMSDSFSIGLTPVTYSPAPPGFSAAVAAAQAMIIWSERNYTFLIREGFANLSIDTLASRFITDFFLPNNSMGITDETVVNGLIEFNNAKGNALLFDYHRNPDYYTLRTSLEELNRPVMVALGGTPGIWVALDGFHGAVQPDGSFPTAYHNPLTGTIESGFIRSNNGNSELYFNSTWQPIDFAIVIGALNYPLSRTQLGIDTDGNDGWAIEWTPAGLIESAQYFIRVEATDAISLTGNSTKLLTYDCSSTFLPGDYNNDNQADMADLMYLVDYFISNGPVPIGGVNRADANCDNRLNITDVIYYVNFIFGLVAPPCQ